MEYSLTNPQNSIWLTEKFYSGTSINNISGYNYIDEPVNFNILSKAINEVVKLNDAMRIKVKEENNSCIQYISEYVPFTIETIELTKEEEIRSTALQLAKIPFNIENNLLFKFTFFKLPNKNGGFFLSAHHIIGDSWSLGLVVKQIMLCYSDIKNNTYTAKEYPSYTSYIKDEKDYLESDKFKKDKEYWNDIFKTVPEVATIPSFQKQNNASCNGDRLDFSIDSKLVEDINNFCKDKKVSLYNFFMSLYSLYLGRVSGLDDFVIGTPVLNRTNFEQKNTMGMFISTAPLRIELNHSLSFTDFVKDISARTISLFRHQKYPYQYILEDLRTKDSSIPNLYNVVLSYQITKTFDEESKVKYTAEWLSNGCCADDLQIHLLDLNDDGKIHILYDYKTDKYSKQDIADLHSRILTMLNQVMSKNDVCLKDIEIVTPEEKHKILYDFNNTKVDYPKDKTIVDLFEEQVKKTPDNIAVVFEDQKLTYKELNEKANQLARYLIENNVKIGDIVGVYQKKGINLLISIIGILKAGAVYMPMHTSYPIDRLEYMLTNSNSTFVISSTNFINNINLDIFKINIDTINVSHYSSENIKINGFFSDALCYVIYTSGSTGEPKGVKITHQNLINFVNAFNKYFNGISSSDNFFSSTNISFDVSIWEIFMPILNGATLVFNTEEIISDISMYCNNIIKYKITALYIPPNILEDVNYILSQEKKVYINKLLVGVEAIKKKTLNKYYNLNNNMIIVNGYGPTETTICATAFVYTKDFSNENSFVSIGHPLLNNSIYILNQYNNICPVNVVGELCISGYGVGDGYINNNIETDLKFIKNPFRAEIMYRTGDLAVWNTDGTISFIGRKDSQVKISGYRIELGEINTCISDYDSSIASFTTIYVSGNIKHLISYLVSKNKINIDNLSSYLSNRLPFYMVPRFFIQIDAFPLTPNGKINVRKLPTPNTDFSNYVAPKSNFERLICNLIAKTLDINEDIIGLNDNLFDLGFDSLSIITFSTLLLKNSDVKITPNDIFNHPIVKDLISFLLISKENRVAKVNIPKQTSKSFYPLSSAQRRIYYASSLDNNSTLYNISGGIVVDKNLNIKKLENCFNILIQRHEALRTHFEAKNDDIVQIVEKQINFELESEDSNTSDLNSIFTDFIKPFDLSIAPLFRAKIVNLNNNKTFMLIDMHHIISDGTSLNILIQELCALYNNETLSDKNIDYTDFCIWEQEQFKTDEFKAKKEFWINKFKDEVPLLNMPTTYPRPSIQNFEGANYNEILSKETVENIQATAKKLNITPYMLMLSCYYILLYKYTSQNDIVVGSPIIGREFPEITNVLGMFVNTLALRNTVDSSLSFEDFTKIVKANCLDSFKNQSYPFDMLVKDLSIQRDPSRNPLFDTIFSFQSEGYPLINFEGASGEYFIPNNNISKFDISLDITPLNDTFSMRFEYCTKLFDEAFIKKFALHYINILNSVLTNEEIRISDINILSDLEKHQILYDFNNTSVDFPQNKSIKDMFEEQVKKSPDNIAIIFENQKLTYKELNKKANQLANYLLKKDIKKTKCIGIFMNRSIYSVISMISAVKLGIPYTLIDVSLPIERINYIISESNCSFVISTQKNNHYLKNCYIINIDDINFNNYSSSNFNCLIKPEQTYAILYTSGSTGTPKGILLHHKGIINLVLAHKLLMNTEICDNFLSFSSVSFDMFQVETFVPLLSGKTIIFMSEEEHKSPLDIIKKIKMYKVNFILSTPSKIKLIFDYSDEYLETIKVIQLGGEILTQPIVNLIRNKSNAIIYDAYGPSEITACCSCKEIKNDNIINIGKPISNTNILILDKDLNILPINVPGEIYVSGFGVSNGYLGNAELTNKSFITLKNCDTLFYKTGDYGFYDPFGDIHYIGRIDNQVKLRGLRIELAEIENKILSFNSVTECCVIYHDTGNIYAFFVANDKIDETQLKDYLKLYLPPYMIPKQIIQLDSMPITHNGKIDRKALQNLPIITNSISNYVAPTTKKEILCCEIWSNLLNKKVGILDDIFELGADSLLAIKFKTKLLSMGINIMYSDIFKYPQIKYFCKHIIIKNTVNREYDYTSIDNLLSDNQINNLCMPENCLKNNILLLGSNGFVGMHIIDSFIKNDSGNIYCIVRDKNKEKANNRFMNTLHFYFNTRLDKYINKRIFIINGNVLKDNFDLSNASISMLNEKIDIVINAAAIVKHYGNEELFSSINIGSTIVATNYCKKYHKRLIHISSLSVSGNDVLLGNSSSALSSDICTFGENNLYIGQNLDNVYINSKFQSEKIILENIVNQKLDAQILRLGNITNRLKDGKFQINPKDNAFINKIFSIIKLGCIPENLLHSYLEFTPVDVCSNAIVLIIQNNVKKHTIYHIYNNNHIYVNDFIKILSHLGIQINVLGINEFSEFIQSEIKNKNNFLDGIIIDLKDGNKLTYDSNIKIKSEFTRTFLYKLGFLWPELDENYIKKLLKDINLI